MRQRLEQHDVISLVRVGVRLRLGLGLGLGLGFGMMFSACKSWGEAQA